MRDMIPPGDRSIRNIPIPQSHRHIVPEQVAPETEYYQEPPRPSGPPRPRRKRRPGRFILWAVIVILVCGGGVVLASMFYAGATVEAHPRTESISASTTLLAQISAPVGTLAFAVVSATQSATTTVPATGTKKVSRQATGVVVITSTYSNSQRFVAGTRLQAPDGKIYKLAGSITLPANSSATATVNAESPGDTYNRSNTVTFTFPGFQGDPRYTTFSAKSQGSMSGGFVGDEPAVAEASLETARAELKAQLDNSTGRILAQNIPATSTAVPGTLMMTYGDIVQAASADKKTATLSQSATATGATVNVRDLASALARKLVKNYDGEAVDFKSQGSLSMSVSTSTKPTDQQITLNLGGDTTLVWQFDPNALKTAMLGKDKGRFQTIVESFAPAITSASATVRPFWIKNFPQDPDKITVDVNDSQ